MTGEELERAIEFLLQSQATLEEQVRHSGTRIEQVNRDLGERIEQVNRDLGGRIAETQQQLEETIRVVQMQSVTQTEFNEGATNAFNRLADAQSRHAEMLRLTTDMQLRVNQALVESDVNLRRALAEALEDERRVIEALSEAQGRTDDKVDRLAETVERFIREGRNGRE